MKAVIKGETHLSKKDKQALMDMGLSEFDAIFREGYENDLLKREMSFLYALFAIGHLVYIATFGRLYFTLDEFQNRVDEHGLDYFDEIDTGVYETYRLISLRKRILFAIVSPVLATFILGILVTPFQWTVARNAPNILPIFNIIAGVSVILLFGFAWSLSFFVIAVNEVMRERDEKMAENIIRISEREDYEEVLVSCGGAHSSGIASELEESGWKTEIKTTESPVGKVLLWKDRITEALLHPRRFVETLYTQFRPKE